MVNPSGMFIKLFTIVINTADMQQPINTRRDNNKWVYGFLNRSHVYKYIPKKIASKKKAKTSINNGKAITLPATCMKLGHSNDSCNPIAVPVTTPIATVMTYPRAQRLAIIV